MWFTIGKIGVIVFFGYWVFDLFKRAAIGLATGKMTIYGWMFFLGGEYGSGGTYYDNKHDKWLSVDEKIVTGKLAIFSAVLYLLSAFVLAAFVTYLSVFFNSW